MWLIRAHQRHSSACKLNIVADKENDEVNSVTLSSSLHLKQIWEKDSTEEIKRCYQYSEPIIEYVDDYLVGRTREQAKIVFECFERSSP